MKVAIMQPPYPRKGEALKVLEWQIDALKALRNGENDLVIFPENSNCTGYTDLNDMLALIKGPGAEYVEELRRTAKRVNCTIMSGLLNFGCDERLRNQLTVFTPEGEEFSPYTKVHLVEPELAKGIVPGDAPTAFEYKGLRIGGAICFDHYFPELFVAYAKQRVDLIVMVSHQRQERPEILEFTTCARAFDSGCTVLRSAPAMPDPGIGGKSMAVSPEGKIIADAGGLPGVLRCEIDPKARFTRAASYGEPDKIIDYREALLLSRSHVDKD